MGLVALTPHFQQQEHRWQSCEGKNASIAARSQSPGHVHSALHLVHLHLQFHDPFKETIRTLRILMSPKTRTPSARVFADFAEDSRFSRCFLALHLLDLSQLVHHVEFWQMLQTFRWRRMGVVLPDGRIGGIGSTWVFHIVCWVIAGAESWFSHQCLFSI